MKKIGDFFNGLFFDPDSSRSQEKMYELEEEVKDLTPESRKLLESRLLKIRLLLHFTKYKENWIFVQSIFSPPIRSNSLYWTSPKIYILYFWIADSSGLNRGQGSTSSMDVSTFLLKIDFSYLGIKKSYFVDLFLHSL